MNAARDSSIMTGSDTMDSRLLFESTWEDLTKTNYEIELLGSQLDEILADISHVGYKLYREEERNKDRYISGNTPGPVCDTQRATDLRRHQKRLDADASGLRDLKRPFEERREALRGRINTLSRPLLRGLCILDMPNEILVEVFEYLVPPVDARSSKFDRPQDNSVKDCRLVCRRFCDLSSQFLIRTIHLTIDGSSLARLDGISRSLAVSKGVEEIKVVLDFHNEAHRDSRAFIAHLAGVLRCTILVFEDRLEELHTKSPAGVADVERGLRKAREMEEVINQVLSADGSEECADRGAFLLQKHSELLVLMEAQQSLITGGGFFQQVLCSVARMPRIKTLSFANSIPIGYEARCDFDGLITGEKEPWDILSEFVLKGRNWYLAVGRDRGASRAARLLPTPDYECMMGVIDAFCRAGIFLDTLKIEMWKPLRDVKIITLDANLRARVSRGMQKLREFEFSDCHLQAVQTDLRFLEEFLASFLDTPSVQNMSLNLGQTTGAGENDGASRAKLENVLGQRSRPNLKHLRVDGVAISDMRVLLQRLPQDINELWFSTVQLLRSTWEEALDLLRDRQLANKECRITILDRPEGAECDSMSVEDYRRVFEDNNVRGLMRGRDSLAQLYIDGRKTVTKNPLRELDAGGEASSDNETPSGHDLDEEMGSSSEEDW